MGSDLLLVAVVFAAAFAGTARRRWRHRTAGSDASWFLDQWDLGGGIITTVLFAVATVLDYPIWAAIVGFVAAVFLVIGRGRSHGYWQWTWRTIALICAVIVALIALIGVLVGQDGDQGTGWDLSVGGGLLGAFVILVVVCLWRNNPIYIVWGCVALAAGLAASTHRYSIAVLLAALAVLVGSALSFGRIVLRVVALLTLAAVIALAVRHPAPAERSRLDATVAAAGTLEAVQQARSDLLVELNQHRFDTAEGDDRIAAATAAIDEQLARAQRVVDQAQPPPVAAGINGPARAVGAWVGHYWHRVASDTPPRPSPDLTTWQWVLLVTAVLVAYRYLEILAARRDPGPVTVAVTRTKPTGDEPAEPTPPGASEVPIEVADRFQLFLNTTELHNSAAVPGGTETERITKILQSESTGNDVVDQILKLARIAFGIAIPVTGYTVSLTSQAIPDPTPSLSALTTPTLWRVTARLSNTRTGRVLGQVTTTDSVDEDTALRSVAYWVAQRISVHTETLPRWARWDTPEAWDAYQDALDIEPPQARKTALEDALRQSPGSALARAELANTELATHDHTTGAGTEIGEAHIRAVGRLLPVTLHFKRFTSARYRLVISLSYFATEEGWEVWANYAKTRSVMNSNAGIQQRIAHTLTVGLRQAADRHAIAEVQTFGNRGQKVWAKPAKTDSGPENNASTQRRIARHLFPEPYQATDHDLIAEPQDEDAGGREAFLAAARQEMRRLRYYTHTPIVAWWALIPSERRYWVSQLREPRSLRHQRIAFRVAHQVLKLPTTPITGPELQGKVDRLKDKVEAITTSPHCGSHAHYNAACFYSRTSELTTDDNKQKELRRRAFEHIDSSIYDPGGGTWGGDWFQLDPDLKALRDEEPERWDQLRSELLQDREPGDQQQTG